MTDKQYVLEAIKMWEWLTDNPDKEKWDYPGGHFECDCPLCEQAGDACTNGSSCSTCLMFNRWPSSDGGFGEGQDRHRYT